MANSFKILVKHADDFLAVLIDGKENILNVVGPDDKAYDFTSLITKDVEHSIRIIGINNSGSQGGNPCAFEYQITLNDKAFAEQNTGENPPDPAQKLCVFHEYRITYKPRRSILKVKSEINGVIDVKTIPTGHVSIVV